MGMQYNKLFLLLNERKIQLGELMKEADISANIIARLKKGESVSVKSIEKICASLNCGVEDIMEYYNEEE